jgi:hypothetical protein
MSNGLQIGDECQYIYKGPHGFAVNPQMFAAKVIGFTKHRVKIEAFDGQESFTATVSRDSLRIKELA